MAGHRCPVPDTPDVVKHDLRVLHVTATLHSLHQIDSTTRPYLRHLEDEDLLCIITLPQKHVVLNKFPVDEACSILMLSMVPERLIALNDVMQFLMFGDERCLLRSKIGLSSSSSNIFCGSPSLVRSNGPKNSFAVSRTIDELVVDGVRSTCSLIKFSVCSTKPRLSPAFTGWL